MYNLGIHSFISIVSDRLI